MTTVWNTIHKFNNTADNSFQPADAEIINNMKSFINDFCPPSASYNKPPELTDEENNLSTNTTEEMDEPFPIEELNMAIDSTKNSSPGLDQVTNKMLKSSPSNFRNLLLLTLNDSFIHHTYPIEWNEFLIVLIPKKNKNKFRPITLASCTLKLIEKIVQTRLTHFLETKI